MDYSKLDNFLFMLNDKELKNVLEKPDISLNLSKVTNFQSKMIDYDLNYNKFYIFIHNRFKAVPSHIHHICEVNYIYSGKITQWVDGRFITLKQGDVIVLNKNVAHAIETALYEDIMINLHMSDNFFSGEFISKFIKDSLVANYFFSITQARDQKNYIIFNTNDNPLLRQTIQNILLEHLDYKLGSSEIIQSYMLIFFGQLLRSTDYYVNRSNIDNKGNIYVLDVLRYIDKHYKEGNLHQAADYFTYSSTHLSRLLKQHVGKTFKALIHEKRISVAYEMLLSTNYPIYKIAEEVGYSNLHAFNQHFKEIYGHLPGETSRIK